MAHHGPQSDREDLCHQHPGSLLCLLRRGLPHRGEDGWPRLQLLLGAGGAHGESPDGDESLVSFVTLQIAPFIVELSVYGAQVPLVVFGVASFMASFLVMLEKHPSNL